MQCNEELFESIVPFMGVYHCPLPRPVSHHRPVPTYTIRDSGGIIWPRHLNNQRHTHGRDQRAANGTRTRTSVYLLGPDDALVHCTHTHARTVSPDETHNDAGSPKPVTDRCKRHRAYLPRSSIPGFPPLEQTSPKSPSCHPTICRWKVWKVVPAEESSLYVRYFGTGVVSWSTCAFHVASECVGNSRHLRPAHDRRIRKTVRSNRNILCV